MGDSVRLTSTVSELPDRVGETFGPSPWRTLDRPAVESYEGLVADPSDRTTSALSSDPPVVHEMLALSTVVPLLREVFAVTDATLRINYGLNRVRFPAPLPLGRSLRLLGRIAEATPIPGGVQAVLAATFEMEGSDEPACIAELVVRYYE